MKLAYSYRLYPDEAQQQALAKAFGCARVVYNDAISLRRRMYEARQPFMGDAECQWRVITFAKTTDERAWLGDVPSVVLIQALADQHARKLARAQRAFARTQKGSENRDKARVKAARLHARVADRRNDYLHKITARITSDNQAVYAEDLAVAALARTRLAKSVYDAGWATLRFQLTYKQRLRGHHLGLHPRFQRSTGVCPATGELFKLTLADRWWDCACGARHDRDIAAAEVIRAAGRAERLNACGGIVSLSPAERTPAKQEVAA